MRRKGLIFLDERCSAFVDFLTPFHPVRIAPIDARLIEMERDGHALPVIVTAGNLPLHPAALQLRTLELLALLGSGFDAIPIAALSARGIAISHAPGANAGDVATHAIALFLAHNRQIVENHAWVTAGSWRDPDKDGAMRSVAGLRVGVVGLGRVGLEIAKRLQPFGPDLAWWGPRSKPEADLPRKSSLLALAQWSDVLFIAARAEAANTHLVDAVVLDALGPDGLIVNVGRGSLIDEMALADALRQGRLGGAALDVFQQEPLPAGFWQGVPHLLTSPHIASTGDGARRAMAAAAAENIRRHLAGEQLASPVPGSAASID